MVNIEMNDAETDVEVRWMELRSQSIRQLQDARRNGAEFCPRVLAQPTFELLTSLSL